MSIDCGSIRIRLYSANASAKICEIGKTNFQGESAAVEVLVGKSLFKLCRECRELFFYFGGVCYVVVVCVFAAYGFAYTVSFYGAVVDASCKVVILPACLSEMKPQLGNREMAEVLPVYMPKACIFAAVTGPTPQKLSTGIRAMKSAAYCGAITQSPSGLR